MISSPQVILAILALIFAVLSAIPWQYNDYLVRIAVILLSIALLVP